MDSGESPEDCRPASLVYAVEKQQRPCLKQGEGEAPHQRLSFDLYRYTYIHTHEYTFIACTHTDAHMSLHTHRLQIKTNYNVVEVLNGGVNKN